MPRIERLIFALRPRVGLKAYAGLVWAAIRRHPLAWGAFALIACRRLRLQPLLLAALHPHREHALAPGAGGEDPTRAGQLEAGRSGGLALAGRAHLPGGGGFPEGGEGVAGGPGERPSAGISTSMASMWGGPRRCPGWGRRWWPTSPGWCRRDTTTCTPRTGTPWTPAMRRRVTWPMNASWAGPMASSETTAPGLGGGSGCCSPRPSTPWTWAGSVRSGRWPSRTCWP
jgi:hypothetical protein